MIINSFLVFVVLFVSGAYCLSEAQLKSTAKLMRNTCQPKNKLTNEQIDAMHKGDWSDEKSLMCYVFCYMKMMKLVGADGVVDMEFAKAQLPQMPANRQEATKTSFSNCANIQETVASKDKCELAYSFAKCLYHDNPQNYFFP